MGEPSCYVLQIFSMFESTGSEDPRGPHLGIQTVKKFEIQGKRPLYGFLWTKGGDPYPTSVQNIIDGIGDPWGLSDQVIRT
jgi:hypothetical protein